VAQRMKWTNIGADLIAAKARDGAEVRQIDEPPEPRGEVRHTHVYLDGWAPVRPATASPTRDAPPPRRMAVRRGYRGPEGEGELLCRVAQNGETGDWMAEDGEGNPLVVRTGGGDGRLEILHHPDNGDRTGDPGGLGIMGLPVEDQRRGFALLSPSRDAADDNPRSLGTLQKLLERHYQRRD
jgi:hypothetical protein